MAARRLETEDESLEFIIGVGSFDSYTAVPVDDKPIEKDLIGFIRPKKKNVQQPETGSQSTAKRKRKIKNGAPKKRVDSKRATRPVRK